jgi:hypothetical protein
MTSFNRVATLALGLLTIASSAPALAQPNGDRISAGRAGRTSPTRQTHNTSAFQVGPVSPGLMRPWTGIRWSLIAISFCAAHWPWS